MRYQPTITITNQMLTLLENGFLTLPVGQWIQLEWSDTKSRWIGRTKSHSLWSVHYPVTMKQFQVMCKNYKLHK